MRHWDLSAVSRLDSAAAVDCCGVPGKGPGRAAWISRPCTGRSLPGWPNCRRKCRRRQRLSSICPGFVGRLLFKAAANLRGMIVLFGQLLLDCLYLARHPVDIPWREFTANVYKAGALALPVTALVGFLIGVTISYLSPCS